MINDETMRKFLKNIDKIKELVQSAGFTNARLLTPALPGQKDELHLLVDRLPHAKTDMFDKIELASKIKALIDCPIHVITEPQIPKSLKKDMLENPISIDDAQQIKKLFEKKLIPFSQIGDFEEIFQTEKRKIVPLETVSNQPMHQYRNLLKQNLKIPIQIFKLLLSNYIQVFQTYRKKRKLNPPTPLNFTNA